MHHIVLETASEENFDEARYLSANADLQAVKRRSPDCDARAHFRAYSKKEGRKQLSAHLAAHMGREYFRFRPVLEVDGYRFVAGRESFPLVSPGAYFEHSDYEAESANGMPRFWVDELNSNPQGLFLDLGCGLRDVVFDNYLYIEVYPSATADIVVTPNTPLPLKDAWTGSAALPYSNMWRILSSLRAKSSASSSRARVSSSTGRSFNPYTAFPRTTITRR